METGVLPNFRHHPWPSTFSAGLLSPLSSNLPRLCAKFSIGTRNHGTGITRSRNSSDSIDGEWRRSTKKRRRLQRFTDGPLELEEMAAPRFLEEFVDNMWFLKVLGSYGYMLPLIIPSWLLASRPKPFFAALSIPIGLSVLTYVFKKLLGWTQSSRKYNPEIYDGINDEQDIQMQRKSRLRAWHQSHMRGSEENGSVNGNGTLSFGGWEDLADEWELTKRRAKRLSRATAHTETLLEKRTGELTQRAEDERDLSPVLRLLVAVLPQP